MRITNPLYFKGLPTRSSNFLDQGSVDHHTLTPISRISLRIHRRLSLRRAASRPWRAAGGITGEQHSHRWGNRRRRQTKTPIFFEFIERKGDKGFGEGNFQALFESIEADQIERGVLVA